MAQFVVLGEASGPIEPGEGAFDDPAFGQHLEPFLSIADQQEDLFVDLVFVDVDPRVSVILLGAPGAILSSPG
jgi:hypothetical protein